ncbi:hypothetical protein AWRI1631_153670 [Saccharomyces cerevisiae AWRI1631]|uniref:Uncharacterized protein n=1 Tax=Saccharomyces cerevisiae (strain AWRI1631) TaxID=545124 RepID=B5VS99_YEAS6|nr:hypothetical protein AWRI1631_153670 [Saccharomyces cerevisiae AWRI1631]
MSEYICPSNILWAMSKGFRAIFFSHAFEISLIFSWFMVLVVVDIVESRLITWRISPLVVCINLSMTFGSSLNFSLIAIVINLDLILLASGLLNWISRHTLSNGLIFGKLRSLQIRINGVDVLRQNCASWPTPPLSPPLIPSTSSMIMTKCFPFKF